MSTIVLATASADLQQRVERATDGTCVTLPLGPLDRSPAALFAQLDLVVPPDVVVLDSGPDPQPALHLAAEFARECPGVSVILVSTVGSEIGLEALRAGVRDILDPGSDVPDIRTVLQRAGKAAKARAVQSEALDAPADSSSGSARRVISVVSPKGGVGKTTVATNLAVGLARTSHHSTVLVDLDLQFGDVASALNLDPDHSLPDTLDGPASRDTMVLKTFLTLHETGLYVICGPSSPAAADAITAEQVSHLLRMLASEFQYVVVDTAPGLSEHVLAAMDESSDLVLVTSMDVPGVRGLRKELDALTELGMLLDSRYVVLNFADARAGLSIADAQATIGCPIDLTLPRSKATPRSVNQGVPLLQSGARDPMTKALRRLVGRFAPVEAKGRLGRSRGQRVPKVPEVPEVRVALEPPPRRAAAGRPFSRNTVA
jgi:pilus assembly protein CpaE